VLYSVVLGLIGHWEHVLWGQWRQIWGWTRALTQSERTYEFGFWLAGSSKYDYRILQEDPPQFWVLQVDRFLLFCPLIPPSSAVFSGTCGQSLHLAGSSSLFAGNHSNGFLVLGNTKIWGSNRVCGLACARVGFCCGRSWRFCHSNDCSLDCLLLERWLFVCIGSAVLGILGA